MLSVSKLCACSAARARADYDIDHNAVSVRGWLSSSYSPTRGPADGDDRVPSEKHVAVTIALSGALEFAMYGIRYKGSPGATPFGLLAPARRRASPVTRRCMLLLSVRGDWCSFDFPSQLPLSTPDPEGWIFRRPMWLLSEYLLTLDQEVELFWGQRLTAASLLFFSNRYLPLLCAAWWTPWWRHLQSFEMYVFPFPCTCTCRPPEG
ncbi:hypothetical protein V8D89_004858, partial [Ganoderma adspersum]